MLIFCTHTKSFLKQLCFECRENIILLVYIREIAIGKRKLAIIQFVLTRGPSRLVGGASKIG